MAKTTPTTPIASNVIKLNAFDPDNINHRLYKQVSRVLAQLEEDEDKVTLKERVAALMAIGRIQVLFANMRKAQGDVGAGATVRKYEGAFSADASRGGTSRARGPALGESDPDGDDWFEADEYGDH
jgi:hypothetical protein